MSKTSITILGLPHLKAVLAEKVAELEAASSDAVAQEVELTREDAARTAPRKTGKLASGIRAESNGPEGTVTSTVRYAGFVEHGTSRSPAQPYMTPAANRARRRFPERAASIIRAALGR